MFAFYIEQAMKEKGCPLCRMRRETEARYVFHTLWENVNDVTFRLRFLASEGLCPQHAWQFQSTEDGLWHDGMKNGILYESLVMAVRRDLARELVERQQETRPWWHPSRWWSRSSSESLLRTGRCPVCAIGEANESFYAGELAHKLVETTWQAAYQASDGLCLPHLRLALNEGDSGVARWLLAETEGRLRLLHRDLAEYLRKHSWQYREESMSEVERQSWIRAIAFARGEKAELKVEK